MKKIVGLILLLIMLQNTTTANAAMSSNAIASKPKLLDGITIYNQGDYRSEYNDKKNGSDDWKLGGYKSRDLKAAGCFLFSFAHAYQWTTCEQTMTFCVNLSKPVQTLMAITTIPRANMVKETLKIFTCYSVKKKCKQQADPKKRTIQFVRCLQSGVQ